MSKEEILLKAIEKAIKNGFKGISPDETDRLVWEPKTKSYWINWDAEDEEGKPYVAESPFCPRAPELLFNHNFAKAFWGEKQYCREDVNISHFRSQCDKCKSGWQYHLQQMVLSDRPIKYLEKYVY